MKLQKMSKLFFAVVLTVAVTVGSGVVAEAFGVESMPKVHACSGGSGGGGC